VLEKRGLPAVLSGAGSAGREERAYVMLVCFFLKKKLGIQKRIYSGVDFLMNTRSKRKNTGHGP
jgi:hypothetical protein